MDFRLAQPIPRDLVQQIQRQYDSQVTRINILLLEPHVANFMSCFQICSHLIILRHENKFPSIT